MPPHSILIHANVTTYDWSALAAAAQFDVIMMDPPWALATANPTRGVALGYRSDITLSPTLTTTVVQPVLYSNAEPVLKRLGVVSEVWTASW